MRYIAPEREQMPGMAHDEEKSHTATWRFSLGYRFAPRFRASVLWSPDRDELGWTANYIAVPETESRPHLSLGTSTDRLDSHSRDRLYFVTIAKAFPQHRIAPYVSVSYSADDGWKIPFGANLWLGGGFSVLGANDGVNTHLLVSYGKDLWSMSLMWISLDKPGISTTIRF